jgi:hypothetical protein
MTPRKRRIVRRTSYYHHRSKSYGHPRHRGVGKLILLGGLLSVLLLVALGVSVFGAFGTVPPASTPTPTPHPSLTPSPTPTWNGGGNGGTPTPTPQPTTVPNSNNLTPMSTFILSGSNNGYSLDYSNLSPLGTPSMKVGGGGTGEVDTTAGWSSCKPGDNFDFGAYIKTGSGSGDARINIDLLTKVPGVSGWVIATLDAAGDQAAGSVQNTGANIDSGGLNVPPNHAWVLSEEKFSISNVDIHYFTASWKQSIVDVYGQPVTTWYDPSSPLNPTTGVWYLSTPVKISGWVWSFWNPSISRGLTAWYGDPFLYIS